MRFTVEAGTLQPRIEDGWVILPVYPLHGEPVELALTPLAAHDLAMVLPGLTEQAAESPIGGLVDAMPPIGDVIDEMQAAPAGGRLERTAVREPASAGTPATITYTVSGPGGAVSLTVPDPLPPRYRKGAALDIHSRTPRGIELEPCEVLPERQCWPDRAGGARAVDEYQAGGEDALYAELEAWYAGTLGHTQ